MKFLFGHRAVTALWSTAGAVALTACAAYQPPQLPANELAVIAIEEHTAKISLTAVDGAGTRRLGGLSDVGERELTLAKGVRTVTVTYVAVYAGGHTLGHSNLTFDAQAGQRYVVRERSDGRKFSAWITDAAGATVPLLEPAR